MKKFYIAGVLIGVLLLAVLLAAGLFIAHRYYVTHDRDYLLQQEWEKIHNSSAWEEKGEIVHIVKREDGYLLYLNRRGEWSRDFLIEYFVTEDTDFFGEINGVPLEDMIKELTPGAYVEVVCYDHKSTLLVEGHEVYAVFAISVEQTSD